MRTSFSPSELIDTLHVAQQSESSEVDIPDGSLIDTSKYKWLRVIVAASIVTGNCTVQFYENDTNSAVGQTALTDDDGNSFNLEFVGSADGTIQVVDIRADSMKRYMNVEVTPGTLLAYTVIVEGICSEYSNTHQTTIGTPLLPLVTMT